MKEVKIKPVLFTSKKYADGTYPIMIRITSGRRLSYEAIGHSIPKEAWNPETSLVFASKPKLTKKHSEEYSEKKLKELKQAFAHAIVLPNFKTINRDIDNRMTEVDGKVSKMKANNEMLDARSIKIKIDPRANADKRNSLIAFGERMAQDYKDGGNIRTYKRCNSILKN